jgi:hypothetical protein
MESFLSNDKITGRTEAEPPSGGVPHVTVRHYHHYKRIHPIRQAYIGAFSAHIGSFCEVLSHFLTTRRKEEPVHGQVPQNSYVLIFD